MTEAQTLTAALLQRVATSGNEVAYRWHSPCDGWQAITWSDVARATRQHSAQLLQLGLQPGDRVVLMLSNSPSWECLHHAIVACGAVVVGIDGHDSDANLSHLLSIAQPRAIVCETTAQLERLSALCPLPAPLPLLLDTAHPCSALQQPGIATAQDQGPLPASWPLAQPDGLATIIFTSGTTGRPKGIAYTHRQLCFAATQVVQCFESIPGQPRVCCWLPLSNLFQRMNNVCALLRGAESWFVRTPTDLMTHVAQINPTLLIGVPRFYEKLHAGLQAAVDKEPGWKRSIIQHAWRLGQRYQHARRQGQKPSLATRWLHPLADRWVLQRLRTALGTQCRYLFSGSAALAPWLIDRLEGLGWQVLEAYGASENVLPITMNTPDARRMGSVGKPLAGNTVTIASDGEILVSGLGVCQHYLGTTPTTTDACAASHAPMSALSGQTAAPLHTGDIGHIDDDGFVWITGRKSDIFKTTTGRRIAPAPLEALLKQLPYVNDAIVCGRHQPFAVVLLNVTSPPNHTQVLQDLLAQTQPWPEWQRPAGAVLIRTPFSIDSGELTPNLKLRRAHIEATHAPALARLYEAILRHRTPDSTTHIVEAA